jgi:hypothetical protein
MPSKDPRWHDNFAAGPIAATMFTVRKNVAAIRRAGRAAGLICASMSYSFVEVADVADDAVLFA